MIHFLQQLKNLAICVFTNVKTLIRIYKLNMKCANILSVYKAYNPKKAFRTFISFS